MTWDEIEVPRELRLIMLEEAEVTSLGHMNGAKRQYRYGNLHIREYDDKYLVHMDKVDPRKNPLGHLIFDAPEVLVGLATAILGGVTVSSQIYKNQKISKPSKQTSIIPGIFSSLIAGYLSYRLAKKIKNY